MTEISTANLLIELGCEELPPKTLGVLAQAFFRESCKGLESAGVTFDAAASALMYSPRRLVLQLANVASRQADQVLERKGPAVSAAFDASGAPTPAALGFARSVGREPDQLERLKTDKGEWLYCRVEQAGKNLTEVLYPVLERALAALPVAKPMRWSDHEFSFVRPVHWLVVLHGDQVLEGRLLGIDAGRETRGHRIHNPGPHSLSNADSYVDTLREAFVLVDPDERRALIQTQAEAAGAAVGGHARITPELLDEVNNIVEWPGAITGRFDDDFLSVPAEALIASMEAHQKFFPILAEEHGQLTAHFIAIANLASTDEAAVRQGYERVIRPRLADARFFWEQDQQSTLNQQRLRLKDIVFQKKLGSVWDKTERMASVSEKIAEHLSLDPEPSLQAACLSKADLVSQMVGEFPELQGVMGGYYARAEGLPEAVASAITEHYRPRFAGDAIPSTADGQIVGLADRLDSLLGIFSAGQKPTGNKDPFALRRAALGLVRILSEAGMDIRLDVLVQFASDAISQQLAVSKDQQAEVCRFILDRARHHSLEAGLNTNVVNAVFAAPVGTLPDLQQRLQALSGFMHNPAADNLVAANKRIGNILRKAEEPVSTEIDAKLLENTEEQSLYEEVTALEKDLTPLFEQGLYDQALTQLATLEPAIGRFFDGVMVMDERADVRLNRLALLQRLKALFDRVGDLSLAT